MAYQYTSPVSSTRMAAPSSGRGRIISGASFGTRSVGTVSTPKSLGTVSSFGSAVAPARSVTLAGGNARVISAGPAASIRSRSPGYATASSPLASTRRVSPVAATSYNSGALLGSTRAVDYIQPATRSPVVRSTLPTSTSFGYPASSTVITGATLTAGGVTQAKVLSGGINSGYVSGYISSPTIYSAPYTVETIPAAGAGAVQSYELKHQGDAMLSTFKEVKAQSGLRKVPVMAAAQAFKAAAAGTGMLTRDQFMVAKAALLESCGVDSPPPEVSQAVFDLFDRDNNGCVDMMEIVSGISLLCQGSEDQKVEAVFLMFDENGDGFVSQDEMFKFLSVVFKVVCTPSVMDVVNAAGVDVTDTDDMAAQTTQECFEQADLNGDGKLSLDEFRRWFSAPRNDPAMLFQPVQELLS